MKRLNRIDCTWSHNLAYILGFIATDGSLSKDGRHIILTSKDHDLLVSIRSALNLSITISKKARGSSLEKVYSVLQITDTNFYEFLVDLGFTPNKSKTIGSIKIPKKYFFDFFRGCIDGDGSITLSRHPESKHAQLKLRLCSASPKFLIWIQSEMQSITKITGGWIQTTRDSSISTLCYGKSDSIQILRLLYNTQSALRLERKFDIAKKVI